MTCIEWMSCVKRHAHMSGPEYFLVNLQVMVIVLWVSTAVAAAFLLAEFILKYEHVRILHPDVTGFLAQYSGGTVMAF